MSNVTAVTYLVREYDEARSWFCEVLDFHVVEDLDLGGASRWLTVSAEHGPRLVLAVAKNDEERAQIGRASGGRVAFFDVRGHANEVPRALRAWGHV
jgi:catechol 2,3-dioxygenase-like lactoylglutathione lyase family enzyme